MSLLVSNEFFDELKSSFFESKKSIVIFSAFVKLSALKSLATNIPNNVDVKIIARLHKKDVICGATDLEVYDFCKENKWKFGIDTRLHGKLYFIDKEVMYLGSANLTRKGLSIDIEGNIEFGVKINSNELDNDKVNEFLRNIKWIDDDLYKKMESELIDIKRDKDINSVRWSDDILSFISVPINYIWINEFVFTTPDRISQLDLNNPRHIHDLALFDLNIDSFSEDALKKGFVNSRLYIWIKQLVKENKSMSFGEISQSIHNSLLDDPKPYRKEIKEYQANIFKWIEFSSDEIRVSKPKHSEILEWIE